jgi:hypothetical protein
VTVTVEISLSENFEGPMFPQRKMNFFSSTPGKVQKKKKLYIRPQKKKKIEKINVQMFPQMKTIFLSRRVNSETQKTN